MSGVKAFEILSYGLRLPASKSACSVAYKVEDHDNFDHHPRLLSTRVQVRCIECCEKNLYLGTSESVLLHYFLEERTNTSSQSQDSGHPQYKCIKQKEKSFGTKKPVVTVKAASAINRLLVLSDGTIFLLNSSDFELVSGVAKIKGVINFCINQDPLNSNNPFCIEICVAKKRSLQIFNVVEEKALRVKDIPLPETPSAMAMDGKYVCVALTSRYALVDCELSTVQEILPYDNAVTNPIIVRISKGEFLLNGPNALGVFVTTARISERPPIAWTSNNLTSITYAHPYVVALNAQSLFVYSVLDYKQKQRIAFVHGFWLYNYDGRLLVATSSGEIYGLVPIPWQRQVQDLLSDGKVDEALDLANHCHWSGHSKEQFKEVYRRFQQEAAFIELSEFHFDRARELFIDGQVDPREIICLYPGLLPAKSNFVRSASPGHKIANIVQMCKGDEEKVQSCWNFIVCYLGDIRESNSHVRSSKEIDVALMKLYAEFNPSELTTLIVAADFSEHMAECSEWLERHGRMHALALLQNRNGNTEKAVDIWIRLLDSTEVPEEISYRDLFFPGLPFVVEFLANLDDANLLWKCANSVLKKDQELGVKIFTERPRSGENGFSSALKADIVTDFLQKYPKALVKYLEYLVFTANETKEIFHTHLAVLYLENVFRLLKAHSNDGEVQLNISRHKLQHLLRTSSSYRFHFLLAKMQNAELYLETALVYGKLEEHDKALRLLVHKSNDPQAATNYCLDFAKDDDIAHRQKLFHTLLGVYLDPSLTPDQRDDLFQPAINLINSELAEFDATAVLKLLPDEWSACIVDRFLVRAMRRATDTRRTKQIERSLAKAHNTRTRFARYCIQQEPIAISEDMACTYCFGSFTNPEFVRFPHGELVHPHCAREMDVQLDSIKRNGSAVEEKHLSGNTEAVEKKPSASSSPVR